MAVISILIITSDNVVSVAPNILEVDAAPILELGYEIVRSEIVGGVVMFTIFNDFIYRVTKHNGTTIRL